MPYHPNIFLIIIDTFRKDYSKYLEDMITRYGFNIYDNAIAPAPWTTPSHASIFTGLYPAFHGAHETRERKDYEVKLSSSLRYRLLSYILSSVGYKTYLFTANPHVSPYFGFTDFHLFCDTFTGKYLSIISLDDRLKIIELRKKFRCKNKYEMLKAYLASKQIRLMLKYSLDRYILRHLNILRNKYWPLDKGARKTIKCIEKKINWHDDTPKFIFINFMETHEPYLPDEKPEEISRINFRTGYLDPQVVKVWREKYMEETMYIKDKLVELFELLKDKKLFDKSLIIITSDHGQLLGEHGRIRHGTFLYDELLKVPLFIKYPDNLHIKEPDNLNNCYISLVNLYYFIINIVKNSFDDALKRLYSNICFSESYGIEIPYKVPSNPIERENINRLEKYRIAVFYKNIKIVFNVTDKRIDEIISYNSSTVIKQDVIDIIKKKIINFLEMNMAVRRLKLRFSKGHIYKRNINS